MSLTLELNQMESNQSFMEKTLRQDIPDSIETFKNNKLVTFQDSSKTYKLSSDQASAFTQLLGGSQPFDLEPVVGGNKPSGLKVAVLFSGGPAAGGHNVILGLKHYLGESNQLLGVRRGPKGLIKGDFFEIKIDDLQSVQNLGGFDFLMSDRTKIKTEEQFLKVESVVKSNGLNGIVVIGGDDSNTNAALLAERLKPMGCCVIGVPKTIDGDLQVSNQLPISFGFDTATKIYSELVGNICQDTASSVKYWHFVKLMGRSASHVTLEVALQTKPAITLISEEVAEKKMSLYEIVKQIAEVVVSRDAKGVNHGLVLVPEGLIEFVPECKELVSELNDFVATHSNLKLSEFEETMAVLRTSLSESSFKLFASLPTEIAKMLLADRDSHGNLQVSLIQTEQLLSLMVDAYIQTHHPEVSFKSLCHFFGYEGRCGAPSRFDAFYTFNLGQVAAALICDNRSGYMASITGFDKGGRALGIPLFGLIAAEKRHGELELVIEKALVTLDSPAFKYFESRRDIWAKSDVFSSPGPRQFWGEFSKQLPITVALNQGYSSLLY